VIFDGQAFVTDGYRLHGYDLVTGKPTTSVVLARPVAFPQKAMPDASPALTIAGNRLYVRAGTPLVRAPEPVPGVLKDEDTFIACMAPSGGEKGMRELWRVKPPVAEGKAPTAWEGAPLVAGRRMWAAYARFEGGRVVHGVACYEPADGGEAPDRAAWVADVSDSLPATTDGRPRQELLTLAGRHVVFCTNDGAVIALDAVSGKRSWGFRYARSRKADVNRSPDPAPAVSCGGRLFLAPADADRVYALDPESGEFLWQSGPTEGAEIVGVAAGKVIIAVSGPVRGLRGLSVVNGRYDDGFGWVQHNGGGQLGYGRGFVTDDVIVWPTRAGLFFVRPQDGELVRPMLNSPVPTEGKQFGNVVYADGVMVVVTPTQVWGYVSDTKRFGPAPGVGPDERGERDPVRTRFEALIEKAENALASGEGSAARGFLVSAIRGDFPKPLRAWAAARLVLLAPPHVPTLLPAPELWPAFDPELNAEWLIPPDGLPVTLKSLLLRHLGGEPAPKSLPASPMVALERKPEDSPTLSDDAEISRTLRLTPGSAPLRWLPNSTSQPKHFFTITADQLLAIPLGEGDNTSHDVADEFTHATDITGGFVAAGRFCVAVYATGRAPIWVFRVPATDKLPAIAGEFRLRPDEIAPSAELSAFRLTGSWLVAKLGERHLIALDLRGKRVAWVLGTNGKPGFRPLCFPDAPRFGSEYFATDTLIVVQLTNGKRWFVNAETGKVLEFPGSDFPTARTPWMLPPTEVEANRLAVSDGPGTVRMLHLATGRMYRTHQQDSEVSLAGPPPQVRAWGGTILIAVTRNQGVELDRFNMKEGATAWATPAFLDATQVRLANADADADRVYLPVQNKVAAFALKDGKSAWEAKLPDTHGAGGWVVKAGSKCIIAYPENAIPRVPMAEVFAQITRSFRAAPQLERLPALAATVYDAWVTRVVPILLLDPETGKELARFDIPASGPAITVWFERDLAVVATGDRVCWLR